MVPKLDSAPNSAICFRLRLNALLAYKAASQNFHLAMLLQVLKIRIYKAEIHVEGFPALGPI